MKQGSLTIRAGKLESDFARLLRRGSSQQLVPRIMARDPEVFSRKADVKKLIGDRLGWVDVASAMKRRITTIETFGQQAFRDGIAHVVLMGMGGSSLCPDVFKHVFGKHPRLKSYHVLDSTDPEAVRSVARKIDAKRSLFIVASKSGGTVETRSQEAFFLDWVKASGVRNVGRHFAAITDKGSSLENSGRKLKYRKVFLNPADIGGRYSALSLFGLVPGFFAGVDLRALLDDAIAMQRMLREREDETNPALVLGALMAAGALAGRDKLTFAASKKAAALVPWIEQLIAESTGKNGKGVVPVEAEPIGAPDRYGKDRLFVAVRMTRETDPLPPALRRRLSTAGVPMVDITLASKTELGRQFLLWEAATAVAGSLMGVNPFDEPNVTESKENTKRILAGYQRIGTVPKQESLAKWGPLALEAAGGMRLTVTSGSGDLKSLLRRFFRGTKPPRYVALLNYFKADRHTEAALTTIRDTIRKKTRAATLRGYGPRYLHSIGQLYKGGPREGLYVVFVRGEYARADIPGGAYDFGRLIHAQAVGDSQALIKRNLPTLLLAIDGRPSAGLEYFARMLSSALT